MALGNNYRVCGVYSPEPCAEVCCVRLNFNILKLVYSKSWKVLETVLSHLKRCI